MGKNELDRSDAKWAHPLLRSGWPEDNPAALELYNSLYKTGMEGEELASAIELGKGFAKSLDDMPVPPEYEEKYSLLDEVEFEVSGCPEEPDAPVLSVACFVPKDFEEGERRPVILFIPAGGMMTAVVGIMRPYYIDAALDTGAVVVAARHRTLPADPYPAAINDCHAIYEWIASNGGDLPIDTDNITIAGMSTGAHLALSLGFRVKKYGHSPRGVVAWTPIVDDRPGTRSWDFRTYLSDWSGDLVERCGSAYLRDRHADPTVGPDAFSNYATVEDCKGYPPAFIQTCEYDPERDHVLELLGKLYAADVYVEAHFWGGSTHTAGSIQTEEAQLYISDQVTAFSKMLYSSTHYDLRRPWTA